MDTELWVVCEVGWAHDDERYYTNGDGSPQKAYRNQEKAVAQARTKHIDTLMAIWPDEIRGYAADGWSDLIRYGRQEQVFKLFNKYDVQAADSHYVEITNPETPLPREFFEQLYEWLTLEFYTVTKVSADLS